MKFNTDLNKHRYQSGYLASDDSMGGTGAFLLPVKKTVNLLIVASEADEETLWDHVSVSASELKKARKGRRWVSRIPTWDEMCKVKDLFFDPEDCVMQLHPPKSDYVNDCEYCLHLWKPSKAEIPRPPSWMVGLNHRGPDND